MSSIIAKKENAKRSGEDKDASSPKKLKDACSGSELTANSRIQSTDLPKLKILFKPIQDRTSQEQSTQEQTTQGRSTHIPQVRIDPHHMPTGDRKVVTVVMSTTRRTAPRHLVSDIPAGVTPDGMLTADLSFQLISPMTNSAGFSRCRHPGVAS